jgi:5-methylcytosine-specific restriction endonuclease McrA
VLTADNPGYWKGKKRPLLFVSHLGERKSISEETRQKMRLARLGKPSWWKGRTRPEWAKLKVATGHRVSDAAKEVMRRKKLGRKLSLATRRKMSENNKGAKSHFWRGGKTAQSTIIRESLEYKLWREPVFKRDGYACVIGGKAHGRELQADHIKPFALFPELRFDVNNGRTLCPPCHKNTDTFAGRTRAA